MVARYTIWAFISAIISVASSLIGPFMIGITIDHMVGKGAVEFADIFRLFIQLSLVYLIGGLFGWLLTYLKNRLANQTVNDLRSEMFDRLNVLPLKYHDNHPQEDSISRFVNDMDAISDGLLQGFATLLTGVVTIIGGIALMLYTNPLMTMVVLLSAPVTFFVARFITMCSQQLFRVQARILGGLNGYVEEMIGGQKVVQAFRYEDHSFTEFTEQNDELYHTGVKPHRYQAKKYIIPQNKKYIFL
ncbi:ABC transporter ATP-binding protein [Bacillus sp. SBS7]|uniref:ABC transporter permease n=1 Tax=Bacillus sp. SBS7 TaxID=3401756 RepID=UPI003AA98DC1